jgi:hypothetical protein
MRHALSAQVFQLLCGRATRHVASVIIAASVVVMLFHETASKAADSRVGKTVTLRVDSAAACQDRDVWAIVFLSIPAANLVSALTQQEIEDVESRPGCRVFYKGESLVVSDVDTQYMALCVRGAGEADHLCYWTSEFALQHLGY